ncbi:MAG: DUF3667 domain-containing protein [Sphingomonadaceae bacterium]|nr:DUF3667 domain-containing protein [Sphingomonadaceae bacterium]
MTGGFEAAGDELTGAVIARAVEPGHGEGGATARGACLNCRASLDGPYCHQCGQAAHVHRTLSAIGHEIAHGVFHFEGKIWRTLPLLLFKPGELTRRYVHGERAKFVSPLALFLFTVFLMFAVITAIAGEAHVAGPLALGDKTGPQIDAEMARQRTLLHSLRDERDRLRAAGKDTRAINARRLAVANKMRDLATARVLASDDANPITNPSHSRWGRLDSALRKAKANPDLVLYKMQSSAYKYSWALIPLSTPFLWLLFFWRRQHRMFDHAVFVTYSLTFMMLLTVALTVLSALGLGTPVLSLAAFLPPVHIYKQLRGAYRIGRTGAALRTFALMIFGAIVLTLFLLLLLMIGVMG